MQKHSFIFNSISIGLLCPNKRIVSLEHVLYARRANHLTRNIAYINLCRSLQTHGNQFLWISWVASRPLLENTMQFGLWYADFQRWRSFFHAKKHRLLHKPLKFSSAMCGHILTYKAASFRITTLISLVHYGIHYGHYLVSSSNFQHLFTHRPTDKLRWSIEPCFILCIAPSSIISNGIIIFIFCSIATIEWHILP